MCGRFSLSATPEELADHFDIAGEATLSPHYNIAPTQPVAVVRESEQGRVLNALSWGLIPSWSKDPSIRHRMINARAETVLEKPSFRAAARRRRCLIPASGFFEWKDECGQRQPYYIYPDGGGLLAFAGLWEHWRAPDGTELQTCTIITRPALGTVARLHDRMPLILEPDCFDVWLATDIQAPEPVADLLATPPRVPLAAHRVHRMVGNPGRDGPEVIAPLETG